MSRNDITILNDIPRPLAESLVAYAIRQVDRAEASDEIAGSPTVSMHNPKASPQDIRYCVSWPVGDCILSVKCILVSQYGFLDMGVYIGGERQPPEDDLDHSW